LLLKPAATNTLVSITTPFMRTPDCEQSMWGDQGIARMAIACVKGAGPSLYRAARRFWASILEPIGLSAEGVAVLER
jgi:hypothetical protein